MHKRPSFWVIVSYIAVEVFNCLVLQAEEWLAAQILRAIVAWVRRNFGGQHGWSAA